MRERIYWLSSRNLSVAERRVLRELHEDPHIMHVQFGRKGYLELKHSIRALGDGFVYVNAAESQTIHAALEGCTFGFFEYEASAGALRLATVYHVEGNEVLPVWPRRPPARPQAEMALSA